MVGCSRTFKYEKFVPEERVCYYDRERDNGENSDLDASCDAGDPYEEIEDAETQDSVQ